MSLSEVSLPVEETSKDDEVDEDVEGGSSSSRQSSPGSSDSFIKKPASSSQWAPSIEDFEIIKPISRGAFGKVFLGRRK
jgi:hypothetical protein